MAWGPSFIPFIVSLIPFLGGIFLPIFLQHSLRLPLPQRWQVVIPLLLALSLTICQSFGKCGNMSLTWSLTEASFIASCGNLLSSDLVMGVLLSELPYPSLDWHGKPLIARELLLASVWASCGSLWHSSILSCVLYWDVLSYLCFSLSSHSL